MDGKERTFQQHSKQCGWIQGWTCRNLFLCLLRQNDGGMSRVKWKSKIEERVTWDRGRGKESAILMRAKGFA